MTLISLPNLFTSVLLFLLGAGVFLRNRKSEVNLSLTLICISTSVWQFFYALAYNTNDPAIALQYFKIGYPGVVFISVTYYHFSTSFLKIRKTKYLVILNYLIGFLIIIAINETNLLVDGVNLFFWGFYPKAGKWHPLFLAFFMLLVNAASAQIAYFYIYKKQNLTLIQQQQLKYILLAFSIFTLACVDFIPNYSVEVYPFGFIPVAIFLIVISYSIVKYRLIDVSLAITRSGIFIFVYSLVLLTPFALAFGLKKTLIRWFGLDLWWLMPLISSTVLATVGPFLYLFIQKRAEDRLLQEQRRYQTTLRQASLGMGRIKEINRLVNLIVHIVTRTVRIEHCIIYLRDVPDKKYKMRACRSQKTRFQPAESLDFNSAIIEYLTKTHRPILYDEIKQQTQDNGDLHLARLEAEMAKLEAVLIIPSFIDEDMLAVIVLGNKFSNKLYSNDDLVVFSILASQAALAIENAQFYEDVRMTHEQLFKAEKMATIGTMADGLSHQINNRLHALGFIAGDALDTIRLKRDLPMSSEVKEVLIDIEHALNRIEDNVAQGGEIVQGLLKYTRKGESGYSEIELDNLINAVMEMAQFKIKPGEMVVHRDYGPDVPKIYGNFTQLQEVFFNLIDNAYDAMMQRKVESPDPSYKPTIKISAQRKDAGSIEIVIQDNGMGIKEDDKTKLFTPFFTTKLSSKKGTGLGLYVIQKLIEESHKGKVSYSSRYREGTRVVILLNTVNSK